MKREFRICALCKNFEVTEQGREFPGIADTEYVKFRCKIFGWSNREDYLMDSEPAEKFAKQEAFDCERFESWTAE